MSWAADDIAGPMGYEYCVLFDCARDALKAYPHAIALPGNICRSVYKARPDAMLEEVDQRTGLAKYVPAHLYGYQSPAGEGFALSLDPLMTGWIRRLKTTAAVVSFGVKKTISLGYGGAFLTSDQALAEEMEEYGHWNPNYTGPLLEGISALPKRIRKRFKTIALWDRYLGDSLIRIPAEQLIPWRVMRRAHDWRQREDIVTALRNEGFPVGTNYPPLEGSNQWGDTVLNFFGIQDPIEIQKACEIIKRASDLG